MTAIVSQSVEQLVEVLRDDHDRRAARREIDDRLMDGGRRARVDPPGRLADDERLGPLQDLAAHDEFLQVAARERAGERARARSPSPYRRRSRRRRNASPCRDR